MTGKSSQDNNLIRENILKYFSERDCITLVRPVEEEKDLQRLNDIPFEKYFTEFKMEFLKLKEKIFKDSTAKRFNGKKLNGPSLANLIREIVKAINKGAVPNINNA